MAHPKLTDDEVADRVLEVLRARGYEGASINRLAEAAGLEKASLYYRFPGGKDEIALVAAKHVNRWFEENVFAPLSQQGSPERRLRTVARRLRAFYAGGTKPCVLEALSLRGGPPELQTALRSALRGWLDAFTAIAIESGIPREMAARRAEQAIMNVEGALVLSRVLGETRPFLHAIGGLAKLLTRV